jgi:hypothetical protein
MFLLPTQGYTTIHQCASCLKFSCPKDSAMIPMFFFAPKDTNTIIHALRVSQNTKRQGDISSRTCTPFSRKGIP